MVGEYKNQTLSPMKTVLSNSFNHGEALYKVRLDDRECDLIFDTGLCEFRDDKKFTQHEFEYRLSDHDDVIAKVSYDSDKTAEAEILESHPGIDLDCPLENTYYAIMRPHQACKEPVQLETVRDLVVGLTAGEYQGVFNSREWTEMPFEWGDQDAACFWRVGEDGKLETAKGVGDQTPRLLPDGSFTCKMQEREEWTRQLDEAEAMFKAWSDHAANKTAAHLKDIGYDTDELVTMMDYVLKDDDTNGINSTDQVVLFDALTQGAGFTNMEVAQALTSDNGLGYDCDEIKAVLDVNGVSEDEINNIVSELGIEECHKMA